MIGDMFRAGRDHLGSQFEAAAARVLDERASASASPWHGSDHWERVFANAVEIAAAERALEAVPTAAYFALLHDCERENDHRDPAHGIRAARYATGLRADGLLTDLSPSDFGVLYSALALHDKGFTMPSSADPDYLTIAVCWDADRLDLGRVGKQPDPAFLTTGAAIARARER